MRLALRTSRAQRRRPEATSHSSGVQLPEQVARRALSGENTARHTGELCDSTARHVPLARLQTRAVPSELAVTASSPSGQMEAPVTLSVCPAGWQQACQHADVAFAVVVSLLELDADRESMRPQL